jgi:LPXTG-site transpeptidase (sortase) family protein
LLERSLWAVAASAALWLLFVRVDRARFQDQVRTRLEAPLEASLGVDTPPPFVGQLEIPGIELSRLVVDGVDERTLRRAVGRIPSSARPGEPGNVVLAGHRDTDFRDLGRLRRGDDLSLRVSEGEYRYRVDSIRVVEPRRVDVLAPIDRPTLTLVTCYPFRHVGPAPLRYIVRAVEVSGPDATGR